MFIVKKRPHEPSPRIGSRAAPFRAFGDADAPGSTKCDGRPLSDSSRSCPVMTRLRLRTAAALRRGTPVARRDTCARNGSLPQFRQTDAIRPFLAREKCYVPDPLLPQFSRMSTSLIRRNGPITRNGQAIKDGNFSRAAGPIVANEPPRQVRPRPESGTSGTALLAQRQIRPRESARSCAETRLRQSRRASSHPGRSLAGSYVWHRQPTRGPGGCAAVAGHPGDVRRA